MRRVALVLVCVAIGGVSVRGGRVEAASSQNQARPEYPCFKHHGRLTAYSSGIILRLWLIGTKREVLPDGELKLPPVAEKYMEYTSPNYSVIYGDFEICPLEPDTPVAARRVRVVSAEKLVVESVNGLWPPFKVMSTWPAKADKGKARKTP
jgi:hypothetical protein